MKPAASEMTSKELRDHAAIMLQSIAKDLRTAQSREQEVAKSQGLELASAQTEAGEEHGMARLDSKFTIEQLFSEYRALRSSVLRLWNDANDAPTSTDIDDIVRFNEAIDQLLAASVFSFARATRDAVDAENRRKDQFLAMLAHELRNPLSPISAAATLLKMAKSNEAMISKASSVIARQVAHMSALVDDLLDVSRITRGAVTLKLESLDLRHVIDDAVEQVLPQIQAHSHTLRTPNMVEPIVIYADKKRLVQIIANLLSNAVKYTPNGGLINVNVEAYTDKIAISVEDNGVGMSADFAPHAFEVFSQAEQTSDRATGGLGLGLALVKSLTELHGGTVTCESAGKDKGSVFTIWLQTQSGIAQHTESTVEQQASAPTNSKMKIMVVDDNVDAVTMLAMFLESTGYDVVTAYRASEALDLSKSEAPDVFVLDIGLPDIDGNELAKRLRKLPEASNAVLIALTGYGLPEDRERTKAAGFDHHLVKPVDPDQLNDILLTIPATRPD